MLFGLDLEGVSVCVCWEGRDRKWTPSRITSSLWRQMEGFNQPRAAALTQECRRRTFNCAARRSCARVKLKTAPLGFTGGSSGDGGRGKGGVTVVWQHHWSIITMSSAGVGGLRLPEVVL